MALPVIKSPLLEKINHGFFTRQGGCSTGLYSSLNCGLSSDDDCDHIVQNRTAIINQVAGRKLTLCGLAQVHSNIVHHVDKPWQDTALPQGDAMVTRNPDIVLAILTADCAPVLFADRQSGIIGAAHAGWKGASLGIVENTIAAMCILGAQRSNIIAAIGPCIAQVSYEVGADFFKTLTENSPQYEQFFIPGERPDHLLFNLENFVKRKLLESEISQIDKSGLDTYSLEDRFFSYRRTTHTKEKDYGRQISVITLG